MVFRVLAWHPVTRNGIPGYEGRNTIPGYESRNGIPGYEAPEYHSGLRSAGIPFRVTKRRNTIPGYEAPEYHSGL
ncbi:MAG: hypothetical protein IPK76_25470 [Lewinellaceae bacterium]|nr:hypothetical protein [Lewinellaceae bacterium]